MENYNKEIRKLEEQDKILLKSLIDKIISMEEKEFDEYLRNDWYVLQQILKIPIFVIYQGWFAPKEFSRKAVVIDAINNIIAEKPIANRNPSGWDAIRGWSDEGEPLHHYTYCMCSDSCQKKALESIERSIKYPRLYDWDDLQNIYNKQFKT